MRRLVFIPFTLAALNGVIGCTGDESPEPTHTEAGTGARPSGSRDGSVQAAGGSGGASANTGSGGASANTGSGGASANNGNAGASAKDGSAGTSASDASDAGQVVPQITSSLGSTGDVHIFNDYVAAAFHEDDTILRSSAAPDCVVHVRSETKPFSQAGTLTIGGPIVGTDGGTASIIEVTPDDVGYYEYAGTVFPVTDELFLQIEASSTATFPAMSVQSLRLPPANPIVVTRPALPDSGNIVVPSTEPFELTWTVPPGAKPDLRVGVRFYEINGEGSKLASLYCSFPISAGAGQLPAELLSEIKSQVGAAGTGLVEVHVGSQKEFTAKGASYVIAVLRPDTLGLQAQGDLQ